MRAKLDELTLSNDAIWEREHSRPQIKCVARRSAGGARSCRAHIASRIAPGR